MEMNLRPATLVERLYTYNQSSQLEAQTGCIGHLQAEVGFDGCISSTWTDHLVDLKTPEFKADYDQVTHALRFDEGYGGMLKDRASLQQFCDSHPESSFKKDKEEFGFRVDTEQFSYLFRLTPQRRDYNFHRYCYKRDWLDRHMKNAERGIRFITPYYKELFRISDGDSIRITHYDGNYYDRICRYIDDCHMEMGDGWTKIYHICEFAELLERDGSTVIPLRSSLPEKCFSFLGETGEIVVIKKGESGYEPTGQWAKGGQTPQEGADALNEMNGITKAQVAAMKAGAFSGWASPAADPKNYNEQGDYIRPKHRDLER